MLPVAAREINDDMDGVGGRWSFITHLERMTRGSRSSLDEISEPVKPDSPRSLPPGDWHEWRNPQPPPRIQATVRHVTIDRRAFDRLPLAHIEIAAEILRWLARLDEQAPPVALRPN